MFNHQPHVLCLNCKLISPFINLSGKKVGTIIYKSKLVSPEIAEISAQTHLELEHKYLNALIQTMNVRMSFFVLLLKSC